MGNFLIFAGTTEGRRLVELLDQSGASVCACVATEYGRSLLPERVKVFSERLDADEMTTMLKTLQFDCVIDATHPYASLVTENIKAACAVTETRYLRLLRPQSSAEGCVYVATAEQAAEVLAATTGRVLLTTGSKELDAFVQLEGYQERICPRVLPTMESIQRCLALGYKVQNIIAMQGPFSREMNGAMMRQVGASILVTKESGDAGGFMDKLGAAQDAGAVAIVIGRPREDAGYPFEEILEILRADYAVSFREEQKQNLPGCPIVLFLENRKILIFGSGTGAARQIEMLLSFGGRVTVISPQVDPALEQLDIRIINRAFMKGDCAGADLVAAVTDSREINHAVYEEAHSMGIPTFIKDAAEESVFGFPKMFRQGNVVIGLTADANSELERSLSTAIECCLEQETAREREK